MGCAMSLSVPSLRAMTTTNLKALRLNYIRQRQLIPRQHRGSGRSINLPTDIRRCDDAIRLITSILVQRKPNKVPLGEFGPW